MPYRRSSNIVSTFLSVLKVFSPFSFYSPEGSNKSPPLKDETTISKLENEAIQLDCITVSSETNMKMKEFANNRKLGRFFEATDIESLIRALKA
jgi:hypothetical protein